jgi:mannose-1-phosphate guanylyltransferase/mannose-6-phosphate isomerase
MSKPIHPVLLCGGVGTRLWPLSRKSYPKQFVKLVGEESLFQSTARRFVGEGFDEPSVVTGGDFRFVVVEQLAAIAVQTGSYLGEDDIIRYDDAYARGQGAKG